MNSKSWDIQPHKCPPPWSRQQDKEDILEHSHNWMVEVRERIFPKELEQRE
eukprot:gnl/Chilomastix_caulleri/4170.p1 GENE.gnl/Chilomastix_caulleri/4170~~gnl/Chilomastix_caulleri/4170.p1  ORF type:complete len:51 (-),score=6.68 gnl/Chilomastix_caulleri/4170:37-189(-)